MLYGWLFSAMAMAAPHAPVTLATGLGGGGAPGTAGGYAVTRWLLTAGRSGFSGEAGIREGLFSGELRTVGSIAFGVRWTHKAGPYARVMFAHHHETPLAVYREDPVGGFVGSADGINHRSGLEVGLGYDWTIPADGFWRRLGIMVDVSVPILPQTHAQHGVSHDPLAYAFGEVGLRLDIGKMWAEPSH